MDGKIIQTVSAQRVRIYDSSGLDRPILVDAGSGVPPLGPFDRLGAVKAKRGRYVHPPKGMILIQDKFRELWCMTPSEFELATRGASLGN